MNEIRRYRLRHRARPLEVLVAGDGPSLLLLHGWGLNGRTYNGSMLALADLGYQVIAPSLAVNDDWSIEAAANSAAEALAGVDASEAIVVGHSFGGAIGVQMALEQPDFVRALIAVNSPLVSMGHVRLGRIVLPGPHYRIVTHGTAALALVRSAASRAGMASLARSIKWFFGQHHSQPLEVLAETSLPRAVIWAEGDSLLPMELGVRGAEALACELIVIRSDESWPGDRPPDHDWPFRHPTHFARTIGRTIDDLLPEAQREAN